MPVDLDDPLMALTVRSSDFLDAMNREMLKVDGLRRASTLCGSTEKKWGRSRTDQLGTGMNLATIKTPMWAQAARVHSLTMKHTTVHNTRWRNVQFGMESEKPASLQAAIDALDTLDNELIQKQRAAAQPVEHRFELVPGDSSFQPVFNGSTLTGWHISQVNHHGNTQGWIVENGILTAAQDKPGNGGILVTDRKYRNFEISLDLNPDYGCDSGLFLRTNDKGEAYQVLIDYLDGGAIGGVYGEGLKGVETDIPPHWQDVWKNGQWNHLRARIEGDVPHIQVWLNGTKITDWRDTANHLPGGAPDGMIALQVHGGNRWIPGAKHRFRNVAVRELP